MKVNQLQYIMILCQYSSILPFNYDPENGNFKRSTFFQIYSIILLSLILIFGIFFSITRNFQFADVDYFNALDMLFIKISLIICFIFYLLMIKDKIFHVDAFIKILNDIAYIEKSENVLKRNVKFINELTFTTTLETIIFPFMTIMFNVCFTEELETDMRSIPFSMSMALVCATIQLNYFPIRVICKYSESILSNLIHNLKIHKNSKVCLNDIKNIDHNYEVYHCITRIINSINQYYEYQIVLGYISIYLSGIWPVYQCFAFIFFALQNQSLLVFSTLAFFLSNVTFNMRNGVLLHRSYVTLLDHDQQLRVIFSDLLTDSVHTEVRQSVSN